MPAQQVPLLCVIRLARGRLPEAGVQAVPEGICLRGITGLLVSLPYPDGGRIFVSCKPEHIIFHPSVLRELKQ